MDVIISVQVRYKEPVRDTSHEHSHMSQPTAVALPLNAELLLLSSSCPYLIPPPTMTPPSCTFSPKATKSGEPELLVARRSTCRARPGLYLVDHEEPVVAEAELLDGE